MDAYYTDKPHQHIAQLTLEEKKFLLAVERGDVAASRRMLDKAADTGYININCADPLGRSALLMAIDNENLEMVELLLTYRVETKDALLHAISEEYVEAVELLLEHEDTIHVPGYPHSWEAVPPDTATFTSDITPLILAAHRDNYEIIKLLLDRGAALPMPHDIRCGCDDCVTSRQEDSLKHSRSRINSYRALASPSLIALSSKDPILTAFELSWELRRLFFAEHEFKAEYSELLKQCQDFATALLDHTRGSFELGVLLNHDPKGPDFEHGERMHLNRLKLAIKFRQKKFVAHPNVQQLLASIWYEGLPGFRRRNMALQAMEVIRIGLLFPIFSLCYIIAPYSSWGQKMRKPFIKFICHSASYFTFLFLLILASQRFETFVVGWLGDEAVGTWVSTDVTTKRGAPPSFVEWFILAWVVGLIWSEIKQLWDLGLQEYVGDMWNVLDFVTNSLYVATIALRIVAHYQVEKEIAMGYIAAAEIPRESWDTWDPMLIAEGLFAAANIFSSLKLVYIFSVNPYLGPLQISLGRMVMDIIKFFFLYILVLFAFSCGMNQLLWYYAELERKRCEDLLKVSNGTTAIDRPPESCFLWRRFSNLFETSQTLFWAVFGLIELESFELAGIKSFTRFWGMLMFGCFSVINIVVLLNLLIAMMNHSYQLIFEKADVEWKFARSKLWISYFEEGGTVPPPFNVIPTPKTVYNTVKWLFQRICQYSIAAKREHMQTVRRKHLHESERILRYQGIIRNLVRRYVTMEQRQADNQGVTEDDVNEIKQEISAFRCELLEVLRTSGMNTSGAGLGQGSCGKKNRQRERRLMKGFNISATPPCDNVSVNMSATDWDDMREADGFHYGKKSPKARLARVARLAGGKREYTKKRWGTIIDAARSAAGMSKLIGRTKSEDSVCTNNSQGSSTGPTRFIHRSPQYYGSKFHDKSRRESSTESKKLDRCSRSYSSNTRTNGESHQSHRMNRTPSAPTHRTGGNSPSMPTTCTSLSGCSSSQTVSNYIPDSSTEKVTRSPLIAPGKTNASQPFHGVEMGDRQEAEFAHTKSLYVAVPMETSQENSDPASRTLSQNDASNTQAHPSNLKQPDSSDSFEGISSTNYENDSSNSTMAVQEGYSKLKGIIQPVKTSTGWL